MSLADVVTITISKAVPFASPLRLGKWKPLSELVWVGSMDGEHWVELVRKPFKSGKRKTAWRYFAYMVIKPEDWKFKTLVGVGPAR